MNTRDINSLIDVLEEYEDDMKIQVFSILTSLWSCEDVSKEERNLIVKRVMPLFCDSVFSDYMLSIIDHYPDFSDYNKWMGMIMSNPSFLLLKSMIDDTDQLNENENASLCVDFAVSIVCGLNRIQRLFTDTNDINYYKDIIQSIVDDTEKSNPINPSFFYSSVDAAYGFLCSNPYVTSEHKKQFKKTLFQRLKGLIKNNSDSCYYDQLTTNSKDKEIRVSGNHESTVANEQQQNPRSSTKRPLIENIRKSKKRESDPDYNG